MIGQNRKALKYLNNALSLFRAVGNRNGEAYSLNRIGEVYSALAQNRKALNYSNRALSLSRAVGNRNEEVYSLNRIGEVYSALVQNRKALNYSNRALSLSRAVGNRNEEAYSLNRIGRLYFDLGEKHKGLDYLNRSLSLSRVVGNRRGVASSLNTIGRLYFDLGEKHKGFDYLNRALALHRAVGNRNEVAVSLNRIGRFYFNLGEKDKGLDYLNRALALHRAVGNRIGVAWSLHLIGRVYFDLGENLKALDYLNRASALHRAVDNRIGVAWSLNHIGIVYFDLGENLKALDYLNRASALHRAVGNRRGETSAFRDIAKVECNRGNLKLALANVKAAIKIIEELRTKIDQQELRTSYFATQQEAYKLYIDLLMELHKKQPSRGYAAQALHISERSRARSLIELLNEANAEIRKDANPQLLEKERNLQLSIDAKDTLKRDLETSPNKDEHHTKATIKRYTKQIENLLQEYRQLQAKIRTSNPKYASLTNPNPEKDILKLPQIQQQLDKDTMLLQYSLGEERSYLWAVTSNSLYTYKLPPKKKIEQAAQALRNDLAQPTASELAKQSALQLSQIILAPVADKLSQKRLVIVADGVLQTIPFAALANPHSNFHEYQPLMINHEIINLPSASTIAIERRQHENRKAAPKALAILADPVYTATDERITGKPERTKIASGLDLERSRAERFARSLKRNGWNRLKHTRKEAEAILKLVPPASRKQALSFDANYDWATNRALNQYRILHFATHGFVNPDQPELSGIVLSLFDRKGNPKRGYLRLADLFNQDYPAELIVLSACETGLGENVNGEGLVGLTRGLMYAGAERVLVSLWQVSDEGTSVLMQEFYKQMLQEGKTPASALRAAQRKLWENPQWRSPYYWAGFTVQGEWR